MNYPQRNKSQLQLLKSAKIVSIIIKNEPKNLTVKTITEKIQYIEITKIKQKYIYLRNREIYEEGELLSKEGFFYQLASFQQTSISSFLDSSSMNEINSHTLNFDALEG